MKRIDIWKIEKRIRAEVIKDFIERNDIPFAVCFSCGNSSTYLRKAGVTLLDISPQGDLTSNRWFSMNEIRQLFPMAFDATSGHLPTDLMREIAVRMRNELTFDTDTEYTIPSGSGETVVCLKMAFPNINFIPQYDNSDPSTEYNDEAPLNEVVRAMFNKIVRL